MRITSEDLKRLKRHPNVGSMDRIAARLEAYLDQEQEDEKKGTCEKCRRENRKLYQRGTEAYREWWCGTCIHREERRINTREMYGRGRRGY